MTLLKLRGGEDKHTKCGDDLGKPASFFRDFIHLPNQASSSGFNLQDCIPCRITSEIVGMCKTQLRYPKVMKVLTLRGMHIQPPLSSNANIVLFRGKIFTKMERFTTSTGESPSSCLAFQYHALCIA